jgi:hypothetical protein
MKVNKLFLMILAYLFCLATMTAHASPPLTPAPGFAAINAYVEAQIAIPIARLRDGIANWSTALDSGFSWEFVERSRLHAERII